MNTLNSYNRLNIPALAADSRGECGGVRRSPKPVK